MRNYVISDIATQRKKYPDANSKEVRERMLTLEQYTSLARRMIGRFAPPNVKLMMLNSDDAVAFVACELMRGDWDYDANRKTKLSSYRGRRGRWAISVFLKRISDADPTISLDSENEDMMRGMASDHASPLRNIYKREFDQYVENLLDSLTQRQRQYLTMYYIEHMKVAEIARRLNVRRQAVQTTIARAIERLQNIAGENSQDD